ncbi:MAG: glycine cleavage system aminomethyltransferase GcvT [Prevotellaceae bacterium]|jgi:aminomethyltransferase|nr:glycine cleavage system aminomethyltransferase GcvT [Prevotellaceae bacterium]
MKTTVFTDNHIRLGAKMLPFAGYNMPVEYSGINDEHLAVCGKAGVFDVSHMGEIWVKGANALAFIQYITSNDAAVLLPGKVQYSAFLNGNGGIVDDLLVYCIDAQTYLLVVNAANIEKDWNFLCAHAPRFHLTPGKELYNASDEICQLAVQGPLALKIVQKICDRPVLDMEYYTFQKLTAAGIPNAILSITGYTGAGGCEIYVANEDGERLWDAVFEAGREFGVQPVGLGARDTLRLEMGFCLYGNDIDDTTSPIEAGLGWITKFSAAKGDFIGRALLEQQKQTGITRKLAGFKMLDKGIPRHGYELCDAAGTAIGAVTSGTMSPILKTGIGLGYVPPACAKTGTEIFVNVRGRLLKAEIVKLPFRKSAD